MAIPNIDKFQEAMKAEMVKNKYKRSIPDCHLEEGIWRNLKSYLSGEDRAKSLVDMANYCAVLWNSINPRGVLK